MVAQSPSRADSRNARPRPIATASPCSRVPRAKLRFERVAERVAQIEQRAAVGRFFLALVVAHDQRLEGAGAENRLGLRGAIAADHRGSVRLAPGEERGVADQPGLRDLGVAGAQLAQRQRRQRAVSASTMRG